MYISHLSIHNFRRFRSLELDLRPDVNVIVGDNDVGKTTIVEAIRLALAGQNEGTLSAEMPNPDMFNRDAVSDFFCRRRGGEHVAPPQISIELTVSLQCGDTTPGRISLVICPDPRYLTLLEDYIADSPVEALPAEYYTMRRSSTPMPEHTPFKAHFIDDSPLLHASESQIIARLLRRNITSDDRVRISHLASEMQHLMQSADAISELDALLTDDCEALAPRGSRLGLSVAGASPGWWSRNLALTADGLPLSAKGKGMRRAIASRLSMLDALASDIPPHTTVIEEPECHLSYSSMQRFVASLQKMATGRQIIITTLSSYVANKLGLDSLILLASDGITTLGSLDRATRDFFTRLAGYDTLRLLLAKRVVLVEGDSDELILQKAYMERFGHPPIADGIDVISVHGLAFPRYLLLAAPLRRRVAVVTDSDGNPSGVAKRFAPFVTSDGRVSVFYSTETLSADDFSGKPLPQFNYNTLEPHILHVNPLGRLNEIFGTTCADDAAMLQHMHRSKSECAAAIFASTVEVAFPAYIIRAVEAIGFDTP